LTHSHDAEYETIATEEIKPLFTWTAADADDHHDDNTLAQLVAPA
jgi:hypothetical protein